MSLDEFIRQYELRTGRSREIYEEARKILPGGVAGNSSFMKPHPLYVSKAKGSKITDVDGNDYIDLLCGGGPAILGHSPEKVMDAVRQRMDFGTSISLGTELVLKLARKITKHMSSIEMLRFVNTGSEATYMAMRAARAFTKKEKIAKFEGNYHGQHDNALVSTFAIGGEISRPESVADCAGIPRYILENVVVLPYNDIEVSASLIRQHSDELAAVIMEPLAGFGIGAVPADKEFVQELRKITEENGVLLIFDEIVTGFRLGGLRGASGFFGVKPDLTTIGKTIGGGFPIGGYGGRRDIMEQVVTPTRTPEDRVKKIFSSGTFTGNPISMAAGLALIEELENTHDLYTHIDELGRKIREGLAKLGADVGINMQITGGGSIFHVHFADHKIRNKRDAVKADAAMQTEFSMGMIANGVFLPPHHPGFTSYAHTEAEIDEVLDVAGRVLKIMGK